MSKHYDYIAIGGGSGGIASINRAAMYGQKCALIEAKDLGGTCVNVGAYRRKSCGMRRRFAKRFICMARTTVSIPRLTTSTGTNWWPAARVYRPYPHLLRQRVRQNKVDVIKGFARFVDAKTVEVNGETITADHILIATGGVRAIRLFRALSTASTLTASSSCRPCRSASPWWAQAILPLSWLASLTASAPKRTCSCVNMRRAQLRSADRRYPVEVMNSEGPRCTLTPFRKR